MPHSLRAMTNKVHQHRDFSQFISPAHSDELLCVWWDVKPCSINAQHELMTSFVSSSSSVLPLSFSQITDILGQKFPR